MRSPPKRERLLNSWVNPSSMWVILLVRAFLGDSHRVSRCHIRVAPRSHPLPASSRVRPGRGSERTLRTGRIPLPGDLSGTPCTDASRAGRTPHAVQFGVTLRASVVACKPRFSTTDWARNASSSAFSSAAASSASASGVRRPLGGEAERVAQFARHIQGRGGVEDDRAQGVGDGVVASDDLLDQRVGGGHRSLGRGVGAVAATHELRDVVGGPTHDARDGRQMCQLEVGQMARGAARRRKQRPRPLDLDIGEDGGAARAGALSEARPVVERSHSRPRSVCRSRHRSSTKRRCTRSACGRLDSAAASSTISR